MSDEYSGHETLIPGTLRGFRTFRIHLSSQIEWVGDEPYWSWDESALLSNDKTKIVQIVNLMATTRDKIWKPGINRAECDASNQLRFSRHETPSLSCTCGFYATYDLSFPFYGAAVVVAAIEASGKIILGTRGFRAQNAKVVAVAPAYPYREDNPSRLHIDEIGKRYTAPVFRDSSELYHNYPPSDVSELVPKEAPKKGIPWSPPIPTKIWYETTTTTTTSHIKINTVYEHKNTPPSNVNVTLYTNSSNPITSIKWLGT